MQAYRLEVLQDCGAYPQDRRDPAVADDPDDAGPVRHPAGRVGRRCGGDQHRRRSAPTAVPGGPRPRPRSSGPWTCSPPRSAWTRPRSGGRTCCRRSPSRTRPRSARCTTAATTRPPWTRCWTRRTTRACATSRPSGAQRGETVQLGIGLACYVEITGAAQRPAPPNENGTVEVHPDGTATILTGTSPHGQGHATVWAMLASDELGIPIDKITVKWGDTDLIPEGGGTGGSRSLQQGGAAVRQASLELIEVARQRAADELEVSAADLVFDAEPQRVRGGRRPGRRGAAGPPGRDRAAVRPGGVQRARADVPVRRARGRGRGGHRDRQGDAAPGDHRRRRRHGGQPPAGRGTAARRDRPGRRAGVPGGGRLRRRRQPADLDASPTTRSCRRPRCPASSWPTWPRRPPTTRSGPRGSARPARSARRPRCRTRSSTRSAHLGVRHIDMPTSPQRVWRALQAAKESR